MTVPELFGLYPKREKKYINSKRTVFRALFIDSTKGQTEEITDKVSKVFELGDPRLQDCTLVLAKPTPDMDIFDIGMIAARHNGLMHNTMHHTIRGIK